MKTWLRITLRELSFLIIAALLVVLAIQLIGRYSGVWIKDVKEMIFLAFIFYGIIGFYRILNFFAKKSREDKTGPQE